MPITTEYLEELTRTADILRALVERLLNEETDRPAEFLARLALSQKPIDFEPFSQLWQELFAPENAAPQPAGSRPQARAASQEADRRISVSAARQDTLNQIHRAILEQLFASVGDKVCAAAYRAVEAWLSIQNPQFPPGRPRTTLGLLWFVAAVHNWLWWFQAERRRSTLEASQAPPEVGRRWHARAVLHRLRLWWFQAERRDPTPEVSKELEEFNRRRHIDAVLHRLIESARLDVGDLLAMHLMVAKLRQLVRPAPREVVIRVTPGNRVAEVRGPALASGDPLHASLLDSLETLSLLSPLSRLLALGIPRQSAGPPAPPAWHWVDRLCSAASAAGVRQYVCSQLGDRLAQPAIASEQVHEILTALHTLHDRLMAQAAWRTTGLRDDWYAFLAYLLWATLEQGDTDAQHDGLLWARWCAGYPDEISLAEWLGRIAAHAEGLAGRRRPYQYPDVLWRWHDLARATLNSWTVRPGYAVLCLGLWLHGYFGARDDPAPLRLARHVTGLSLEQLVAHWKSAIQREREGREAHELSAEEHHQLLEHLQQLHAQLMQCVAYTNGRQDLVDRHLQPEPLPDAQEPLDSAEDTESATPMAKIIVYHQEGA